MKTFFKSSLLILALLLFCAWQALPAPQEKVAVEKEPTQAPGLFKEKCARCHGVDGRGQTVVGQMVGAPNFTDKGWWDEEKGERRFVRSITEGKGEMPAFGKKLTRPEIRTLAAYVKTFRKTER
jgi:mono/diheme cytochrome c family protein